MKKDELKTTEFSLIYDQEEKLSNTQLMSKIQGTYMESNMIDWSEDYTLSLFLSISSYLWKKASSLLGKKKSEKRNNINLSPVLYKDTGSNKSDGI